MEQITEKQNPLGVKPVGRLLLEFSVPAMVGMIVNALYNVVDRIYIGNSPDLGANGLAGITIGFPIMIMLLAMALLFGIGGATMFSIKLGEGKTEEAEQVMGVGFLMLLTAGVVFMVLGQIFLTPLLRLFGASETVLPYSLEYMRIIFFGAAFQTVSLGMNHFMRADGSPRMAMITMFLGAGTNIVLDPIFIYVFHMGMAGAAVATILSQLFSTIWIMSYFLGKKSNRKLKRENIRYRPAIIARITALGMPTFMMQVANSLLNVILNKTLLTYGGDIAISGMGVVNSIQTLMQMPITGLNQGVQPIVSFNFGAKKYDRVKRAEFLAVTAATVIVIIGYVMTRLIPQTLVGMFNKDPQLMEFGVYALKTWFLCFFLVGFQIIASNFFQCVGRSKSAMFLVLTRQVILLLPAILLFSRNWGLQGVLYAAPFADCGASAMTAVWYYFGIRSLGKQQEQDLETAAMINHGSAE